MKLKECVHGILVQKVYDNGEIGMIVGVTNNISQTLSEEQKSPDRAIPLVQWQSGPVYGISPSNIKKL